VKSAIAYTLVIFGVTQLIAMWVGSAIVLPIARLLPYALKVRALPLLEFFNGAAALALAIALFWLLGASISVLLPFIVGAWLTFYFFSYSQSKVAWLAADVGVITCWLVYRLALS
jgi:hypothetical protein